MNKKDNSLNLDMIIKPISYFFGRFHLVTFVVVVLGGLALTTYLFYSEIVASQVVDDSESIEVTMPDFDADTITRLDELKQSDQATDLVFPSDQRINPFAE